MPQARTTAVIETSQPQKRGSAGAPDARQVRGSRAGLAVQRMGTQGRALPLAWSGLGAREGPSQKVVTMTSSHTRASLQHGADNTPPPTAEPAPKGARTVAGDVHNT